LEILFLVQLIKLVDETENELLILGVQLDNGFLVLVVRVQEGVQGFYGQFQLLFVRGLQFQNFLNCENY
jgi:hypothetical protein